VITKKKRRESPRLGGTWGLIQLGEQKLYLLLGGVESLKVVWMGVSENKINAAIVRIVILIICKYLKRVNTIQIQYILQNALRLIQ
jgi:hypothetical protein